MKMQITSLRGVRTHYVLNNLIDGGLKITATDRHGNVRYATISTPEAGEPYRFILDLLEKYEPTEFGRIAIEAYLDILFAYWAD